jgi:hypothetical protein
MHAILFRPAIPWQGVRKGLNHLVVVKLQSNPRLGFDHQVPERDNG